MGFKMAEVNLSDYVSLCKDAFTQVEQLLKEPIEPNWEYVTEVEACAMYRRIAEEDENNTGIYTVQTMAKFDGYVNTINQIVQIKEELVEPVNGLDVLYVSFSMPWPITARDFVHIRGWREYEGGYLTSAKSTLHPNFPETPAAVRGSIDVDGFWIQPNPKDPQKSIVKYIAKVDPKGSIPTFAVNLGNRKVPQTVSAIRTAIGQSRQ